MWCALMLQAEQLNWRFQCIIIHIFGQKRWPYYSFSLIPNVFFLCCFGPKIFCDWNFGASLESIRYTYHMDFSCKTNISHVSFRLTHQNMCVSLRWNTHTNYFAFLIDISNVMVLTGMSVSVASHISGISKRDGVLFPGSLHVVVFMALKVTSSNIYVINLRAIRWFTSQIPS